MNYSTTVDDVEVTIALRDIKEAVEEFDDDSREELIEHLQELLETNPKDGNCDEYNITVDDIDVEVEVDEDELLEKHGDRLMNEFSSGKILIDCPTLTVQMEMEEAIKAVFDKHGLKADDHVWGIE